MQWKKKRDWGDQKVDKGGNKELFFAKSEEFV
jgi:hypothetical protein